jgi:hypothetical protein
MTSLSPYPALPLLPHLATPRKISLIGKQDIAERFPGKSGRDVREVEISRIHH